MNADQDRPGVESIVVSLVRGDDDVVAFHRQSAMLLMIEMCRQGFIEPFWSDEEPESEHLRVFWDRRPDGGADA